MSALRVAFDLDGVLADFESTYRRIEIRLFGSHTPGPPADEHDEPRDDPPSETGAAPLSASEDARRRSRIWQEIHDTSDFWASLDPIEPAAVPRIHELAVRHGWEVFFVTQRPETLGDTVQRQTQRWLVRHGFAIPSVIVLRRSRGKAADALHLDFLIDDSVRNCVDIVSESRTKPLLVVRGRPESETWIEQARRLGIDVLASVAECLAVLELASDNRARDGIARRLGQMFGRKT